MSSLITLTVTSIFILNIFLAIALIFLERRDPTSTWAWILVLFFIPLFGFILYLLFGRKLRRKHSHRWEGKNRIGIETLINYQIESIEKGTFDFRLDDTASYQDMIYLHLRNNHAVLTQDNDVQGLQ